MGNHASPAPALKMFFWWAAVFDGNIDDRIVRIGRRVGSRLLFWAGTVMKIEESGKVALGLLTSRAMQSASWRSCDARGRTSDAIVPGDHGFEIGDCGNRARDGMANNAMSRMYCCVRVTCLLYILYLQGLQLWLIGY